jgi:hypothetical protein
MIKPVPLPADSGRLVWVVKVPESIDAPHAIQNPTRIYIRVNNITEPIQLADIDRIEYLLNRRRDPEQRREQMIEAARKRSGVSLPRIWITIGPTYPHRPLLAEDELERRLEKIRRWKWRRIQQGFISVATLPASERFEINLYGLVSYAVSFSEDVQSTRSINPAQLIYAIGSTLNQAAFLLLETTTNLFMRASLEGILGYMITPDPEIRWDPAANPYQALEDPIVAEKSFPRETLDEDFRAHITDLIYQLVWAFDWANKHAIAQWVAQMSKAQWSR